MAYRVHNTSNDQHPCSISPIVDANHVLCSNDGENFRYGLVTSRNSFANDDMKHTEASPTISPHFEYTSTPATTPYTGSYAGVTKYRPSAIEESQRQRSRSASSSQKSSMAKLNLASVQFSIEATRAAAMSLKRQEEFWGGQDQRGHVGKQQTQASHLFDERRTGQSVIPSVAQVPIHHPDFDLDAFLNSQHLFGEMPDHSQAQTGCQLSLGQQQSGHLLQGFRTVLQTTSADVSLESRQTETILADPSIVKELYAFVPLQSRGTMRTGTDVQPKFKDPFVNSRTRQQDTQTGHTRPSSVLTQSPSKFLEDTDLETPEFDSKVAVDIRPTEEEKELIQTPQVSADDGVKDKKAAEEASRQSTANSRGKVRKPKRIQFSRPRVIKAKVEDKKLVGATSKSRSKAIARTSAATLSKDAVEGAVPGGEAKEDVANDQKSSSQGDEPYVSRGDSQQLDVGGSKAGSAAYAAFSTTSQVANAAQALVDNTGPQVCENTQRELEMLLRQDLAMKMQEAPVICSEVTASGSTANTFGDNLLYDHTIWRSLVGTSTEQAACIQGAATVTYDHLTRFPMHSGLESTTALASPAVQFDKVTAAEQLFLPFVSATEDTYASMINSSSAKTDGEVKPVNKTTGDCPTSKTGSPPSEATVVVPSTAPPAQVATCFCLAQDNRNGELGWITELRSTPAAEPASYFPVRPLMNGVLAQLHNDWLTKQPLTMANQTTPVDCEVLSAGEEGGSPLLPPANFQYVQPTDSSVHIRTLWRDLEKRRYLFANDDLTLKKLQKRAEEQLRFEVCQRAGHNPRSAKETWSITTRPTELEITQRALNIWECARTAATYSLGLLRQAEYCIAQSEICFAPMRDWDSKDARPRTSASDPPQQHSKEEHGDGEGREGGEDRADGGSGKRQRMSRESISSASRNATDDSVRSNGSVTASSTSVGGNGGGSSTHSAKVNAALMRLASTNAHLSQATLPRP